MHILLIHQAFAALNEPGGTRHHELARYLAQKGHRVTVIASPEWANAVFAMNRLEATGDGWILLVESEVTDSTAHDTDAAGVAQGVLELDLALAAVLNWTEPRGDTLVVVTADHDTGGLGIVSGVYSEPTAGVRWASDYHTAQWVPVFAFGPGAEHFGGVIDNTDIGILIAKLLEIEDFPRFHP